MIDKASCHSSVLSGSGKQIWTISNFSLRLNSFQIKDSKKQRRNRTHFIGAFSKRGLETHLQRKGIIIMIRESITGE